MIPILVNYFVKRDPTGITMTTSAAGLDLRQRTAGGVNLESIATSLSFEFGGKVPLRKKHKKA